MRAALTTGLVAAALVSGAVPAQAAGIGRWVPIASQMASDRWSAAAALLPRGQVLVAGGVGHEPWSADLYDPRTRTFTRTGDMTYGHANYQLFPLADGTVLAPGGSDPFNEVIRNAVELFHPRTGAWTLAADMHDKRAGYAGAVLPDGRVLVAGGQSGGALAIAAAEIYDPGTARWQQITSMQNPRLEPSTTLFSQTGGSWWPGGSTPMASPRRTPRSTTGPSDRGPSPEA